jgi:pimeloyl-ACP methyl ester carboxylesterase
MSLALRLQNCPLRLSQMGAQSISYRSSGAPGPEAIICLHGIGSSSATFIEQLDSSFRLPLLAWDAPGYGSSSPIRATDLELHSELVQAYAMRLLDWLDSLGIQRFVLVGHSLGAIVATRAANIAARRTIALLLLAPALGYGRATPQARAQKLADRLQLIRTSGPAEMAKQRAQAMVSKNASIELIDFVETVMAGLNLEGYSQAASLLIESDLRTDLEQLASDCKVRLASGSADTITPPAALQEISEFLKLLYIDLGVCGHACTLEASPQVNRLIANLC